MSKLVVSAWPLVWRQIGPDVCLEFWMDNSVTCNLLNDKAEHIEHTKKRFLRIMRGWYVAIDVACWINRRSH